MIDASGIYRCELIDPFKELKNGSLRTVYLRDGGDYILIKRCDLATILDESEAGCSGLEDD